MGLSDYILLIDRLGVFGVLIVTLFLLVMFVGSLVDIVQFAWMFKRAQKRRDRIQYNKIRAQVLLELHEREKQ